MSAGYVSRCVLNYGGKSQEAIPERTLALKLGGTGLQVWNAFCFEKNTKIIGWDKSRFTVICMKNNIIISLYKILICK